ncbi:hypothetical protein DAEQUDRAFT_220121 [Daedalea quercina L-15889]|uniref:Uncharacterized protein n=1 Tax=Daedalea quercina L-15889 TaxID=1314783 RepID=A0A165R6D1_9APHY|nr:hypothetical protein DAEQUDRAFT_220121 [Daedalea quercina L-15889]
MFLGHLQWRPLTETTTAILSLFRARGRTSALWAGQDICRGTASYEQNKNDRYLKERKFKTQVISHSGGSSTRPPKNMQTLLQYLRWQSDQENTYMRCNLVRLSGRRF